MTMKLPGWSRETELEAEIREYLDELNPHFPSNVYTCDLLRRALAALKVLRASKLMGIDA